MNTFITFLCCIYVFQSTGAFNRIRRRNISAFNVSMKSAETTARVTRTIEFLPDSKLQALNFDGVLGRTGGGGVCYILLRSEFSFQFK